MCGSLGQNSRNQKPPPALCAMLHGMDNLADNKGLSRVEVVCVVGIACFAVALLAVLGWYLLSLMWQGNDANALNTAQGVGNASAASVCLVPGCPGEDDPAHASHVAADGSNVAYYQKGTNTLVADPPAGYNEGDSLVIDGKDQHVERDTCVIEVVRTEGSVTARWVFSPVA